MNSVPWLRSGTGITPADGGCILQVIDWIDRNEWTDSPPCVHPVLRKLAIKVNDTASAEGRQRLLDLAPRLMGTNSDDRVLAVRLAVFCARWVLPEFERAHPGDDQPRCAIEAAEAWCDTPCEENRAFARAAALYAASDVSGAASYAAYVSAATAHASAYAAYAASAAAYAVAAAASAASDAAYAASSSADVWDLLTTTLNEYDRLTGRTTTPEVDWTPVCRVLTESAA